jgi:hypothetical protein
VAALFGGAKERSVETTVEARHHKGAGGATQGAAAGGDAKGAAAGGAGAGDLAALFGGAA